MITTQLINLFFAILITLIGALPFGLVNLTVVNVAIKRNKQSAIRIAYGAAVVEVLFGVTAILSGSLVYNSLQNSVLIKWIVIGVLLIAGIYFLQRKKEIKANTEYNKYGFAIGAFLNIISIQVLLYWFVAIGVFLSRQIIEINFLTVIVFSLGIWLGKMSVLWLYAFLGRKIVARSVMISNSINRIIGSVLVVVGLVQIIIR